MNERTLNRFFDKVIMLRDSGCWLWVGCKNKNGYGLFKNDNNKTITAHRTSYEHWNGVIPKGLVMDHLCRVRHCVNPDHLEAVTQRENCRRGNLGHGYHAKGKNNGNGRKTHCPKGHIYDEKNTYINKKNHRICRKCNRLRWLKN